MLQGQKSGGTTLDELSSASRIEGNNGLPQWFVDAQTEALREFAAEPYPSRKDEHWRFSSVKNLDGATSLLSSDLADDALAKSEALANGAARLGSERIPKGAFPEAAGRIIFVNDQLVSCELLDDSLNERGVIFLPLDQPLKARPGLLQEHFMA